MPVPGLSRPGVVLGVRADAPKAMDSRREPLLCRLDAESCTRAVCSLPALRALSSGVARWRERDARFIEGEGTAKPSIVFCTLRERLGVVVWCRKAGERKKTEGLKSTWPKPALPGMAGEACSRRRARTARFNNRTACAAAGLTVV